MLRSGIAVSLVFVLLGSLSASAVETTTHFLETHYYLLSLGQLAVDADSVRQAAQSSGFTVVAYEGDSTEVFRGGNPVSTTAEAVLSDDQLVVVDSGRFLLRQADERFVYSVRPSEGGYDLVIDPQQDLEITDVLGSVLMSLQAMGILGTEASLELRAYAKDDPKGPPPPVGIAIESTLFSLLIARDWFDYAAAKGLTVLGLRVEVVAEVVPGSGLEELFAPYVIEQTDGLSKLLLPIDQLLALARSSAVAYVRSPYHPSVP